MITLTPAEREARIAKSMAKMRQVLGKAQADTTEQDVKDILIDPSYHPMTAEQFEADVEAEATKVIPVDDEHKLIDESVKLATMITPEEISISPSRGDKKMDESFPKYQYSIFLDNNRNGQMVIRADSWEEFEGLLAKAGLQMQRKIEMDTTQMSTPQPVQQVRPATVVATGATTTCPDCGSVMVERSGVGAKGPWKGLFCPNGNKADRQHHKTIWL